MRTALLWLSLAACGDDAVHHLADAAPGSDVSTPDGPRQTAQVSISQGAAPRVGIHIIVTDLDGSDGGTFDTDATGLATVQIYPGGAVTAVDPYMYDSTQLFTIADVQPGDLIEIAAPAPSPTIPADITLATYAGAADYAIYTACGSGPVASFSFTGCGSTTPLLALALDATSRPIASIWEDHAPVASALDLSAVPWVATADTTYPLTHLPADASGIGADFHVVANEGLVYDVGNPSGPITGGSTTVELRRPTALGLAKGVVDASYATNDGTYEYAHHALGTATGYDFAEVLPDMTRPMTDGAQVHWTRANGTAIPDAVRGMIQRDSDSEQRYFIAPLQPLLDSDNAAALLPPVNGHDLSGTWTIAALTTIKAGGGEKALREKGFANAYAFAADGTASMTSDVSSFQPQ